MTNTATLTRPPRIGEVYHMLFSGTGCEQKGWRPGVVFQNNTGNIHSPNIIALPLTSSLKHLHLPTHVLLDAKNTGLLRDSIVLCENPERISKERLGKFILTLSEEYMKKIAAASLIATSAISFLDEDSLLTAWKLAIKANSVCGLPQVSM